MKKLPLFLIFGVTLSACGGGSSTPTVPVPAPDLDAEPIVIDIPEEEVPAEPDPDVEPIVVEIPEEEGPAEPELVQTLATRIIKGADADFFPTLAPSEETVTLSVNGEKAVISVVDGGLLPSHRIAGGDVDGTTYIVGIQGTDVAEAGFVSGLDGGNPDAPIGSIFVERLDDTLIPTTGAATFDGDYLGVLANTVAIAGDASLTADFANGSISGVISNRRSIDAITGENDDVLTSIDLVLEMAEIDTDGAFSGSLSGGDFGNGEDVIAGSNGFYVGLITGEEGDSVAGGLRNEYELGLETGFEVGSFIAD